MVSSPALRLFVLTVMLVSAAQIYLIVRYLLWPRIQRIIHCPWCWRDAGIESDFPAPWSSTICSFHHQMMRARKQAKHSRPTRHVSAAAVTKSAMEARQPQAEEVLV